MQTDRWKQVQQLFDTAEKQPPEQRFQFLQQNCPDDSELRDEVMSLLKAAETSDTFLDSPAVPPLGEHLVLMPGDKAGSFEILALIGRGGMGEVYRARDLRLDRDVALKVLPVAFASDQERLRRFQQEARAASQLNHPNILAIYDIGTHSGTPYIVSELLEGVTLQDCLAAGSIPVSKAIDYALQVANGLAAAHQKGIIHRDLKPANLFLTTDGRIKILDFGLAKLTQPYEGPDTATLSPDEVTEPGLILGTVGYMSPEQVRGLPADARSDVFSFGVILYALLTGQRAFQRESMAETMIAILRDDPPDPADLNPQLSPGISLVVRHCLEKRPEDRFESVRDLAFALEAASGSGARSPLANQSASQQITLRGAARRWPRSITAFIAIAATAILAVLLFTLVPWRQKQPSPLPVVFEMTPSSGQRFDIGDLSPDGKQAAVLVMAPSGSQRKIWTRTLASLEMRPVPGTEDSRSVRWSPDGRKLVFEQAGQIRTVDLASGTSQALCEANGGQVWDWGANGVVLFSMDDSGGKHLYSVRADGGMPKALVPLDQARRESEQTHAQFLPGGNRFLYYSKADVDPGTYIASLDDSTKTRLPDAAAGRQYMRCLQHPRTGRSYLLSCSTTLCAVQEFDPASARLLGSPKTIARVGANTSFSAVPTVMAFSSWTEPMHSKLAWFSRSGHEGETVAETDNYTSHELSPDNLLLAWELVRPPLNFGDIWVKDLMRGVRLRLTSDEGWEYTQRFFPDGKKIAFMWFRDNPRRFHIATKPAHGSGTEELVYESPVMLQLADISPDGQLILYERAGRPASLWILPLSGNRKPILFQGSGSNSLDGRFSPDGRWIAYASADSGRSEIHVRDFAADGRTQGYTRGALTVVSSEGGRYPQWSSDGKELFYVALDNSLMAVEVTVAGQFTSRRPRRLFRLPMPLSTRYRSPYSVSRDAHRFLLAVPQGDDHGFRVIVMTNWMESIGQQ